MATYPISLNSQPVFRVTDTRDNFQYMGDEMVVVDFERDYYEDLQIPKDADEETIKKSFRQLGRHETPFLKRAYI